jgi:hypothetical protein
MLNNHSIPDLHNESFDEDKDAIEMMTSIIEKEAIDNLKKIFI